VSELVDQVEVAAGEALVVVLVGSILAASAVVLGWTRRAEVAALREA
jgi:hypothetical protein